MLADSLTLCQETCPMTTANLVDMARPTQAAGQGNDVVFVTATVDPERDTPSGWPPTAGCSRPPRRTG